MEPHVRRSLGLSISRHPVATSVFGPSRRYLPGAFAEPPKLRGFPTCRSDNLAGYRYRSSVAVGPNSSAGDD